MMWWRVENHSKTLLYWDQYVLSLALFIMILEWFEMDWFEQKKIEFLRINKDLFLFIQIGLSYGDDVHDGVEICKLANFD